MQIELALPRTYYKTGRFYISHIIALVTLLPHGGLLQQPWFAVHNVVVYIEQLFPSNVHIVLNVQCTGGVNKVTTLLD